MRSMRTILSLVVAFLILGMARAETCVTIPGAEQLWTNASIHWLLIGEVHGSNETPRAFANLVCDALAHGRDVTVALERPTSEQAALDGILTKRNLRAAQNILLAEHGWRDVMDGRASEAMLRLLLNLRELRKKHKKLVATAFDAPFSGGEAGARDKAMGEALLAIGEAHPKYLVLVLTGNIHAMQSPQFGYNVAAMYLPPGERISLEVTDTGGESWTNSNGACGPSKGGVQTKGKNLPFGIFLDPSLAPYGKVDGVLSLGAPLTSSAPAAGEPSPPPPCRIKYLSEHPDQP
jgi:hypothetical protein